METTKLQKNCQRLLKSLVLVAGCLFLSCADVSGQASLYPNEFSLKDVKLLNGPFRHARDLNIETLLKYDVDRLLAGFRKQAGLPQKAIIYPNWDGLDGHVGGHYLSALAMNYAATGDTACRKRLQYMIAELKACQDANGKNNPAWAKGYAGAVPNGTQIWSTLKNGDFTAYKAAWVPWYNVHKIYAGLRDAWIYTGNEEAKNIFLQFCDWGIEVTAALSDEQLQSVLDMEHGGMNEVFADAYQLTGHQKYITAAKRFSHHMLLDAMAAQKDNLDNKHANTQVPKAIGFERIAELTGDSVYTRAGRFFWETVTAKRSLAFGGNSRREFFPGVASSTDFVNDIEGPESCNSYNMLKLTEDLFREDPQARYADYYERTLYNHILSTQHPVHGGYVYFTPARPRHYRVYSVPNQAMWCCVGSGMENHSKYSQFIYTRSKDSLYLNLFIASELNWKEKKIKIKQETLFPAAENTTLRITEGGAHFALMIRYPSWVNEGALQIVVNGKKMACHSHPGSYVAVSRVWKKGDVVNIQLPMHNTIEQMPNVPNYAAMMHGPVLLAAKAGTEDLKGLLADDSRWAQIPIGKKLALDKAPIIIEDTVQSLAAKLKPVDGRPLFFAATNIKMINGLNAELQPFYTIHDARYMMYWMVLSNAGYQTYIDSVAAQQQQQLILDQRTVDFVAPGEQQPEADHFMDQRASGAGNYLQGFWRDARDGGYFSYQLGTDGDTSLNLMVRYWGNEKGKRNFDIYLDDQKLATEDIAGKWGVHGFRDIEYPIPAAMIKGKVKVRVKFQALPGNTAGAVYYVRLVKK